MDSTTLTLVMREYAAEFQRIYDLRTAGDYTFLGVLADFLTTLKLNGVEIFNPEDK